MSNIEWTDKTWNPIIGCSKTSEACEHCYAERMAARLAKNPATPWYKTVVTEDGKWNGAGAIVPHLLKKPLSWRKPCRVFVGSMTDMFHESMPDEWRDKVFDVIADTPHITYQILTKRPERMKKYMQGCERGAADIGGEFPWPNLWIGVTVENQDQADKRMPILMDTPAAVRFVSVEPMLGPISLQPWHGLYGTIGALDWVICGGETGPKARRMDPAWAEALEARCLESGTPYFFKKHGDYWKRQNVTFASEPVREFPANYGG